MFGNILGNVDGITLRIGIGTELCTLDGPIDGYNDSNLEGLLLG